MFLLCRRGFVRPTISAQSALLAAERVTLCLLFERGEETAASPVATTKLNSSKAGRGYKPDQRSWQDIGLF